MIIGDLVEYKSAIKQAMRQKKKVNSEKRKLMKIGLEMAREKKNAKKGNCLEYDRLFEEKIKQLGIIKEEEQRLEIYTKYIELLDNLMSLEKVPFLETSLTIKKALIEMDLENREENK